MIDFPTPFFTCGSCIHFKHDCPCVKRQYFILTLDPDYQQYFFNKDYAVYNPTHRICRYYVPHKKYPDLMRVWHGFDWYYDNWCLERGRNVIIHPALPLRRKRKREFDSFLIPECDFLNAKIINDEGIIRYVRYYRLEKKRNDPEHPELHIEEGGYIRCTPEEGFVVLDHWWEDEDEDD